MDNFVKKYDNFEFEFSILNDKELLISNVTGEGETLYLPGIVYENEKQYEVTKIGSRVIKNEDAKIDNIIFANQIKQMAPFAFKGLKNLKSVTFSNQLKSVSKYAFYKCVKLNDAIFPEGIESIEQSAFNGCVSLPIIGLPNSMTNVEINAFLGTGLTYVCLPDNLQNAEKLLLGIENLKIVSVSPRNKFYKVLDGLLYKDNDLIFCPPKRSSKTITVAKGTTNIKPLAIMNNDYVKTIVFPESLTEIEENGIYACHKLKTIKSLAKEFKYDDTFCSECPISKLQAEKNKFNDKLSDNFGLLYDVKEKSELTKFIEENIDLIR